MNAAIISGFDPAAMAILYGGVAGLQPSLPRPMSAAYLVHLGSVSCMVAMSSAEKGNFAQP